MNVGQPQGHQVQSRITSGFTPINLYLLMSACVIIMNLYMYIEVRYTISWGYLVMNKTIVMGRQTHSIYATLWCLGIGINYMDKSVLWHSELCTVLLLIKMLRALKLNYYYSVSRVRERMLIYKSQGIRDIHLKE